MRLNFPRESYIPKGAIRLRDKESSAVVYAARRQLPNDTTTIHGVMFSGKRNKPDANYTYRDQARFNKAVREHFESVRLTEANRKSRAAARRGVERGLEVGDVLRSSWGYEQTNIDYYEVTKLIGKTMVEVREIAQERVEKEFMQGRCCPVPGEYVGKPLRRKAEKGCVKVTSCSYAYRMEPEIVAGAKVYESSSWTAYH